MAVSALRQRKKNLKPCPELVDHYNGSLAHWYGLATKILADLAMKLELFNTRRLFFVQRCNNRYRPGMGRLE
jgi:hypothetical protein